MGLRLLSRLARDAYDLPPSAGSLHVSAVSDRLDQLRTALGDRYLLDREIGRGGMARVYLALDRKHDRKVALKVLDPDLRGRGYHPDRFLQEIRTIAKLMHPQILPLHDSDERDGFLYYVMPYVEGGTLREYLLARGPVGIEEAVDIAASVAGALDYAHRHDVLHRDVKPENIFLQEHQPLVADFGIARAISACCDELAALGLAAGTPAYMSPEQANAEERLDGRSDVYSLACVLYEMLTGRPPFEGASAYETLGLHMLAPVPRLAPLRPDVPAALEAAVTRALAKSANDRFASAAEFAAALRDVRASPAATVPSSGVVEDGPIVAVLPFQSVSTGRETEYLSEGITDELINALAKVEDLRVVGRTPVFALDRKARDVREMGAQLGATAVLEGSVRVVGERLRVTARLTDVSDGRVLWSERYDREMRDVFAIEDEVATTIVSTLRPTLVGTAAQPVPRRYTENVEAYSLYLKGRFHWNRRSREGLTVAIEHFDRALALDSAYALAHSGLADAYALQLDYRGIPVREGMERAKREARTALALDATLAEAHASLAWVTFIYDWDWTTAERHFRRAIELKPGYATAHQWYAWLLAARGRQDDALAEARIAMRLDPISVSVRRGLGWQYCYARRPESGLRHLQRAVMMDPTSSESYRILAYAHALRGAHDAAATAVREALVLDPESAYALAIHGYIEARSGRPDVARDALAQLTSRAEAGYVSPVAFATLAIAMEDVDAAFRWLEAAYRERRGWLTYLAVEPLLDPLRRDPRFADLLRRMKL
jgi:serine/threonine-protein kinase